MARERSTKTIAKRISLDYFRKPHPFRTWKKRLAVGATGLAVLVVGGYLVSGDDRPYSAGALSSPHRLFDRQCARCHVERGRTFLRSVTDAACSDCHEGVVHQANQRETPACADCHVEHETPSMLVSTTDAQCTRCHSHLATGDGAAPRVRARVVAFTLSGHPEFVARREPMRDGAALRFNHRVHLEKERIGPEGPVALVCATCHRADADRALMAPVSYEKDCRGCHALTFDLYGLFPAGVEAPHGRTIADTAGWVRSTFAVLLVYAPDLWRRPLVLPPEPERRLPPGLWRDPPPESPRSAVEWLDRRTDEATLLLVRRSCGLCHDVEGGKVVDPAVPPRWLPASEFRHEPHRFLRCASCHAEAARSQETSDILVPGMSTCLSCHNDDGAEAARARCVTCHRYHPGPGSRGLEGRHSPGDFLRAAR